MIEYLLIAGVGAWLASRGKPQTRVEKNKVYGPKTGVQWDGEWFPELQCLSLSKNGAKAVFRKTPEGLRFESGSGNPRIVELMRKDIET